MFTHIDDSGRARVVDVSGKDDVVRIARAEGVIYLKESTVDAIRENRVAKGNVLNTATVAGILAAKKTSELIPMCHPLQISSVSVDFELLENGVRAACEVKYVGKTGVEMEALVGVTTALLTVWDMVKSLEKDEGGQYPVTRISDVRVVEKVKREK
ncbi:molybdenum cofactor biosynthesis protein MoaC [Geoglobus ahangari]|uniref:Probable cyclic pyranopterin monophosphate synthase n=1 Tax=Geoglobus ahangari TaxID=113653 RepID=A0A0F7IJW5_9EURY|nr:cyclic pyranopterin monophosphate synthase MoaC [Geoglobus ahangari]AKG92532.1 molybdenum cofactor biosynthesis protein MoaC [Geoglobus ahangari]